MDHIAEILAAWHWIEPQAVHQSAIQTRMLWPRVILPDLTVRLSDAWLEDLAMHHNTTPYGINAGLSMWHDCHRLLQEAYSTGEVPQLFPRASRSWDCLRFGVYNSTFVLRDLGDLTPKNTSVLPVQDRAMLADEPTTNGIVAGEDLDENHRQDDDPDENQGEDDAEEHLYMSRPPTSGTGQSHS